MKPNRIRLLALIFALTAGAVFYVTPPHLSQAAITACADRSDPEGAIKTCTSLLETWRLKPAQRLRLLNLRQLAHDDAGNSAARLADLDAILEMDPDNLGGRVRRASALYDIGANAEAIDSAEGIVVDHPDAPEGLNMLAYLYRRDGRNDLALPLLERSRAVPQDGDWADKTYARALADAGRPEDAIPVYVEALVENPEARWAVDDLRRLAKREATLHTAAARSLLPHVREDPGRADLTEAFLMSCIGAGEACPALYPDRREARTEITCEAALTEWVERNPGAGAPIKDRADPRSIADHVRDGGVSAYIVAAYAYVAQAVAFIKDPAGEDGRDMILLDRMLHCTEGPFLPSLTALAMEGLVFEDGNGFDDFFHIALRDNLLDVAWSQADPGRVD